MGCASVPRDRDDTDALRTLSTCRAAMTTDARPLVIERVVPDGNAPAEAKLFGIDMPVVAGGRERTVLEYRRIFEHAGLALSHVAAARSPLSVIVATAPLGRSI